MTSASPAAGTDPLTSTLLTRPSPVLGTDKQRHVVYDFELGNVTRSRVLDNDIIAFPHR